MMTIEHVKAVNLRMPGIKVIPTALLTVFVGLTAYLGILKDSFVRGLPLELVKSVDTTLMLRSLGVYALFLIVLLPLFGLPRLWKRGSEELPIVIANIWIIFSCSLPLASTIALLYGYPIGWRYFVLAIITTILSDSAAYFVGKAWGKHQMVSTLSPNKTWEGTLGGLLATIIFYLIYVPLLIGKPLGFQTTGSLLFAFIAAVLMSAVSTFGDLTSSAIKRWCNIKILEHFSDMAASVSFRQLEDGSADYAGDSYVGAVDGVAKCRVPFLRTHRALEVNLLKLYHVFRDPETPAARTRFLRRTDRQDHRRTVAALLKKKTWMLLRWRVVAMPNFLQSRSELTARAMSVQDESSRQLLLLLLMKRRSIAP